MADLTDEATYDRVRLGRRAFLSLTALTAASVPLWTPGTAVADTGPIVKPLPEDTFIVHGTNAETRWEALADIGNLVPADRFFVRNHTGTPRLSADTWRLRLFGTGLRGTPTADNPSSIKWLGSTEVSGTPLFSPWNTRFYRFFGPDYPAEGELVGEQNTKSAFELPCQGTLAAGRVHQLHGRSWSGAGGIRKVEVSADGGRAWRRATPHGNGRGWQRWSVPWRPAGPGSYPPRARATDTTGATQPAVAPYNTQGYLFGAVVDHPVTVT